MAKKVTREEKLENNYACGMNWKTKKQRENGFRKLDDVLETLEDLNLLNAKGRKFRTHIWRKYWNEPYSETGEEG